MKVKLLKKIRKRYSITHYPNGCFMWGSFQKGTITLLTDKNDSWRWEGSWIGKEEAYGEMYSKLLKWIQQDYGTFKSAKLKITSEQLWYKK
jgi:hypothetical protein